MIEMFTRPASIAPGSSLHCRGMPEELNVEVASTLAENAAIEADTEAQAERHRWRARRDHRGDPARPRSPPWSGYQAARWDGRQELYGHASTIRIQADEATTLGGQQRLLDVTTFNTWSRRRPPATRSSLSLRAAVQPGVRSCVRRRIAAGGLTNPNAPPGPGFMPEYENSLLERGRFLNERATTVFESGTEARGHADEYVRTTVVLATVLFLLGVPALPDPEGPDRSPDRVGALMTYGLIAIALYPRF